MQTGPSRNGSILYNHPVATATTQTLSQAFMCQLMTRCFCAMKGDTKHTVPLVLWPPYLCLPSHSPPVGPLSIIDNSSTQPHKLLLLLPCFQANKLNKLFKHSASEASCKPTVALIFIDQISQSWMVWQHASVSLVFYDCAEHKQPYQLLMMCAWLAKNSCSHSFPASWVSYHRLNPSWHQNFSIRTIFKQHV